MRPVKKDIGHLRWSFTSEKKKAKLLDSARRLLRLWPETASLLQLAADKGIDITFNDALLGTDTDGQVLCDRKTGRRCIELKPARDPSDIAVPLIHELRHLWQAEVLGLPPEKAGLGEKDAATALLLTRVKEADAFAFTNLMISRLNHAQQDFAAADKMTQDAGDEFLAAQIAARIPAETEKMGRDFLEALTWLDSYDRETLSDYHRRYAHPFNDRLHHLTGKDGHVLDVADIRKLLRTGTAEGMPPYLDGLDDAGFVAAVMKDVAPPVASAISAVDAFEKAARRPSQADALALDTQVRRALAQTP